MPMPKYHEIYKPYLAALMDNEVHKTKEVKQRIIEAFNLSEEEAEMMLASGTQTILNNRIGWNKTYLKHAGLIETPSRFEVKITADGIKVYQQYAVIDDDVLAQFPGFCEFKKIPVKKEPDKGSAVDISNEETPQDTMQRVYDQINDDLANEVLEMVLKQTPAYFEHLVVKRLEKMGYCKELKGHGITTQSTSDGGIDGVIYQDRLGFDKIYIQAKKWDPKSTVSRPEIQKFFGAMAGQHASKGLFITTTSFSQGAIDYATGQSIILVDGDTLAKLMIEYELGVSTEIVYKIRRIDTDFFMEE